MMVPHCARGAAADHGTACSQGPPGAGKDTGAAKGDLLVPGHGGHGEAVRGEMHSLPGGSASDGPGAAEVNRAAGLALATPAR